MNRFFWTLFAVHLMVMMIQGIVAQTNANAPMEASMVTVPYFEQAYDPTNPPTCNSTFLEEFSSGVWEWIHGLIEFAIRDHDFTLDQFTMSDQPYQRYLQQRQQQQGETTDGITDSSSSSSSTHGNRRLLLAASDTKDCKTCPYLGCNVWCSPRFCRDCPADDDQRRRQKQHFRPSPSTTATTTASASSSSSNKKHPDRRYLRNTVDYNILALKISTIVTAEAQSFLFYYDPEEYACMGVASGLQVDFNFIPFE